MSKYLDNDGLLYLWQKIKTMFATLTDLDGKVDKVTGKGLSTNDYTTAEKNKLSELYDKVEVLYEDALTIRFALERDNVSIAAGQSFTWFGAHVNLPGYRPKSIAGTRLYNATSGGANYLNCGFIFCEVYRNTSTQNYDIDFAIRNHGTAAAKIRYRIEILYQKVRS